MKNQVGPYPDDRACTKIREATEHTYTELNRLVAKEQRYLQSEDAPMEFTKEFRGCVLFAVVSLFF